MGTYVVGTAGHVDHGKSSLVKRLTGIDPDRLREEKERQLTIDLGFAWMELGENISLGIIDVPGHRDFIENMLAGIGGIDAALLVIAADEGIMPQTQEHLEILDLLEVQRGLVALSKIDLIDDESWLDLVEQEIRETLAGTSLAEVPICRVSSTTGQGVDGLKETLTVLLGQVENSTDTGRARIPVDRAFSLTGYGTIVTGTLVDGHLKVGENVHLMPQGLQARIRGLQTHKQDVPMAVPGSRVAVNLAGIDVDQIQRGDVLVKDPSDKPTGLVDARVRVLPSSPVPLEHNQEVKLFVGSDQKMARLRVLGGQGQVSPGASGWIQIMTQEPMVVRRGDRYILRRPSPPLTMAGGTIVDAKPPRRYRLSNTNIIDALEKRLTGDQAQLVWSAVDQLGVATVAAVAGKLNLPMDDVRQQLTRLKHEGSLLQLKASGADESLFISGDMLGRMRDQVVEILEDYHSRHRLRLGMPAEELRSRLNLKQSIFIPLLQILLEQGAIQKERLLVRLPGFEAKLSESEASAVAGLIKGFETSPYSPPSIKECQLEVGAEVYQYLVNKGELIEVSEDVVFQREDYEQMVNDLKQLLQDEATITVAGVRDRFNTSRKYVLALLEHLDQQGLTVREGDHRRLAAQS
jgi:selenocysteine-specific elongation factor